MGIQTPCEWRRKKGWMHYGLAGGRAGGGPVRGQSSGAPSCCSEAQARAAGTALGLHSPLLPLSLPLKRSSAGKRGVSFLPCVQGKTQRKSRLSRTGRGGTWQPRNAPCAPGAACVRRRPPHPRRQLALQMKGKAGHTLHLPLPGTPLPLLGRREVADGKCHLHPKTGCSTAPVVAVGPCTFSITTCLSRGMAHPGAVLAHSGLLLLGTGHAGAHPSDASALYQMLLQDAGPSSVLCLHPPPGWPCHKRHHGNAVTSRPAAHYDAGTAACPTWQC